jgi:hypothetical protein
MADLLAAEMEALQLQVEGSANVTATTVEPSALLPGVNGDVQAAPAETNGEAPAPSTTPELDRDNDVEGKVFVGGISWQTSEESLRCVLASEKRLYACTRCCQGWGT